MTAELALRNTSVEALRTTLQSGTFALYAGDPTSVAGGVEHSRSARSTSLRRGVRRLPRAGYRHL
jgi:hypothetical protein